MPQRTANFAKVATVAGPAMPTRTGQTMSWARSAAIQRRIGAASKPNWVTSDTSSPCRRANATFGPQRFAEGASGDPWMALRIAGERDLAQAVALDQAGGQQVEAVGKRAHRVIGIAADDQG